MNSETRICQNCKQGFVIEPEDFNFYTKMSVPAPTFCPECRMIRRMTWRNERSLYKRTCGLTGKEVITGFGPDSGVTVYDRDAWWSDERDPFASGADYDWHKPFFVQFRDLLSRTPMPAVFNNRCTDTPYANHSGEQKNGYLVFASWGGENLRYAAKIIFSKDSMDVLASRYSELLYEGTNSNKMYRCAFVQNSEACSDSYFLYDCKGCINCFGCVNLRNKSYHFFNEPLAKEEYQKRVRGIDLGSFAELARVKERFAALKQQSIHRFASIFNCDRVTGDNLYHVSNSRYCFDVEEARDSKFLVNGGMQMEDSYDGYGVGANSNLLYEVLDTGSNGSRFLFDLFVWDGFSVQYSYACHGSQNLLGCIGLNKKQYCILNKQYTKEEYEALVPRIIAHMNDMPYVDAKGREHRYGEFFPTELSPFAYNETIAQEYFSLTKKHVLEKGYRWREPETRHYQVTVKAADLPDHIRDVSDDILNQVIGCSHNGTCNEQCTTAFRIIPDELAFYRNMNLALPRLCPNCRHYARLAQRNPMKLWHRRCACLSSESASVATSARGAALAKEDAYRNTTRHFHSDSPCSNEFETPYAPDRKEIIYCEQCYNGEVV